MDMDMDPRRPPTRSSFSLFLPIPTLSDPPSSSSSSSSSSSDISSFRHRSRCRDENIHDIKKPTCIVMFESGYGTTMADDATSGCTEEEKVAVEQLSKLRRIRKFSLQEEQSGKDTGNADGIAAADANNCEDANEDSNSNLDKCQEPSSSSNNSVDQSQVRSLSMYPKWRKAQHKCGYVSSSSSITDSNKGDPKSGPVKVVEEANGARKNVINESHGTNSSNTCKRRHQVDADSGSTHYQEDVDFDSRPWKKTRLLTDIYSEKSKQSVYREPADADRASESPFKKKVHIKGRRKSLHAIMGKTMKTSGMTETMG